MRARLALVLVLLCFSTSMLSGCIGLVASRELMEGVRGEPDTDQVTIPYSFEHTFDSTNPEDIIHNPEPKQISIDLEVKEMRVFFRVQMPYSEIAGLDTANVTSTVRYVHAKLWEPDANKNTDAPFWEENTTTDHYPPMKRFYPPFDEGVWELEVRAQGYGWTSPVDQLSFHDEFEVSVSVVRPCILFPELEGNEECIPV